MKAIHSASLILFAALAAACSSEPTPQPGLDTADSRQLLTIEVASCTASRSGRPLDSSAPGQSTENVKVFVADETGTVVWARVLDKWNSADAGQTVQSSPTEVGREATIEIPKDECRLADGKPYRVVAVGYSNGSDYDLTALDAIVPGATVADALALPMLSGVGEEIFAGECTVTGDEAGVRATLTLTRQVAGSFGYIEKIPYVRDLDGTPGRYLILEASAPASTLVIGNLRNDRVTANGTGTGTTTIWSIDLLDWFKELKEDRQPDGSSQGVIAAGDNWKGLGADAASRFRNGSVYAGTFLVPFAKTDAPTLRLKLTTDAEGTKALRTWVVLLPAEQSSQLRPYTLWTPTTSGWTSATVTDTRECFSVVRNVLYSIGARPSATLGDNPDDPDNPDIPTPINNKQDLSVSVNQNWHTIYNMDID